jgi:DNA modification methylase
MSIQLLQGDCLEIMRGMEAECIDLTVTSPPYDNLRAYRGYSFDFEPIARELYRVTKPGGVVVWVVGDATVNGSETGTSFKQALYFKEIGFNLHDTMIYQTAKPPLTHNRYEQEFEYMFVFSKGKPNTFNAIKVKSKSAGHAGTSRTFRQDATGILETAHRAGRVAETRIMGNVWNINSGYGHGTLDQEAFSHPATFPEALARDHILSWSNPGDTVLDCFLGSGTTGKMAVKYQRNFIGMEIAPEYLGIARTRIERVEAQPLLFELFA